MKIIIVNTSKDKETIITHQQVIKRTLPIAAMILLKGSPGIAFAEGATTASAPPNAARALAPLLNNIRSAASPIAEGSMLWGVSKVMLGQRTAGWQQVKDAATGLFGVKLVPSLIKLIMGA